MLQTLTRDLMLRVDIYRTWQDPRPVLDAQALDQARRIAELTRSAAGDTTLVIAAMHAVAWLHWCRGQALPEEEAHQELLTALGLFARLWDIAPEDLRPTLVPAELAPFLEESGTMPESPEAAAYATGVDADLRPVGEPQGGERNQTEARGERIASLCRLAQALLVRYLAHDEPADLDEAVDVCLTMSGLLTPDDRDRPDVRDALTSVLKELSERSDDPARLRQSLLLTRVLLTLTGIPMPGEMRRDGEAAYSGTAPDTTDTEEAATSAPRYGRPSPANTRTTDVTLGDLTVAAVTVDDSDLDRFLATARGVCETAGVVLVPQRPFLRRGQDEDDRVWPMDLECLVESVGDCAAVPLAAIDGSVTGLDPILSKVYSPLLETPLFPCLLAGYATIRHLVSYADELPPDEVVCRSRPVRTDFREWAHLWALENDEESAQGIIERLRHGDRGGVIAHALAEALATGHQNGALHGDAHIGNFGWGRNGKAAIIDHEARFLYRPPTSAQCATDLAPLLPTFSPSDWRAFRLGYLHCWPEGRRVIDLMEFGDTTGWMQAMASRDFHRAADLLDDALRQCPLGDEVGRMVITANRAHAYSRVERHGQAWVDAESAWKASRTLAPHFTPLLALHAALTRVRAGDHDTATQTLLALIIGTSPPAIAEFALRMVLSALPGAGTEPGIPGDELPFLARKGNDLMVTEFFKPPDAEGH